MIIMIISFARAGCFFGSRGRKTVICRVDFFFCCSLIEKGFSREDGLECGSQIFAFKGGLMVSNNTVDLKLLEGFPPFFGLDEQIKTAHVRGIVLAKEIRRECTLIKLRYIKTIRKLVSINGRGANYLTFCFFLLSVFAGKAIFHPG